MFKQIAIWVLFSINCFGFQINNPVSLMNFSSSEILFEDNASNSLKNNSTIGLSRGIGLGLELPSINMSTLFYFPVPQEELSAFILASVSLSSIDALDNYYDKSETWAGETLGDSHQQTKSESTLFGGGIGFGVTPTFILFAGGGFRIVEEYAEYYDPFEILSSDGHYWVNSDSGRNTSFSGIGGCVFGTGNPMYNIFIFASLPPIGVQAGVSFAF
jgi:hypothetical protein